MTEYAELHCHSFFSLLDGASSPEALVETAHTLGLRALALTDHDSLAGVVRFWRAARRLDFHAILGAEVTLEDGCHLTLLAETQAGYANLCRLITASRLDQLHWDGKAATWPGKIEPALSWARLAETNGGLIALSGCPRGAVATPLLTHNQDAAHTALEKLLDAFGPQRLYIELQHHPLPHADYLNRALCDLARRYQLPLVATGNTHYAKQSASRLRDAFCAIRHNETLTAARRAGHLPLNSSYALTAPHIMARHYVERPQALQNSLAIAERCQVSLDFSGRRLPTFPTPAGQSEFQYLYQLCHDKLAPRYPQLHGPVLKQLAHELDIIERAGLAGYFLIVWDIVKQARRQGHPLPRAWLGGQFDCGLSAGHYQHRPTALQPAL